MDLHLQPDWQRTVGQRVEIWKGGKLVRKGTVEAVMPDDSFLWISTEGASLRQMVFRLDGYEVFSNCVLPRAPASDNEIFRSEILSAATLPRRS